MLSKISKITPDEIDQIELLYLPYDPEGGVVLYEGDKTFLTDLAYVGTALPLNGHTYFLDPNALKIYTKGKEPGLIDAVIHFGYPNDQAVCLVEYFGGKLWSGSRFFYVKNPQLLAEIQAYKASAEER